MKKILSLLLVLTLIFTFSGCFGGKKETKKEETTEEETKARVVNEAQEYLKKNYPDDEFTYVSGRSPNWAYQYYELGFNSKKYDNQQLTVFGTPTEEKNEDGLKKYDYDDNYYQYYMIDDAEKYFYDIAKEYISDDIVVKVDFIATLGGAKKIDKNLDFANNYKNDNLGFFLYIFTENDTKENEEAVKSIIKQFKNNGDKLWLEYVIVSDLSDIKYSTIKQLKDNYNEGKKSITFSTSYEEENNYQKGEE